MIRRPPRSTPLYSSAASDVYKRQHTIHASKVDCKGCHQENGQVVVPQCTRCHDIDKLHAFTKIGKLTSQTGLKCSACHTDETKLSAQQTSQPVNTVVSPVETAKPENQPESPQASTAKIPGFAGISAIGFVIAGYMIRKRGRN